MAKFYVQSGKISYIVGANDAEGAAMWAMHQTIENMVDKNLLDPEFEDDTEFLYYGSMLDGLAQFAPVIRCSQIGFGRTDAGELETEQVFLHWNQLREAADRLFDQLN